MQIESALSPRCRALQTPGNVSLTARNADADTFARSPEVLWEVPGKVILSIQPLQNVDHTSLLVRRADVQAWGQS